jgi:hypothetical protein
MSWSMRRVAVKGFFLNKDCQKVVLKETGSKAISGTDRVGKERRESGKKDKKG